MSTNAAASAPPGFLVFDCESVPDGLLIGKTKYPRDNLSPEEATARAQQDARETSYSKSDFLPVSFQVPVAVCIGRIGTDYRMQGLTCLDAPRFRPGEIVRAFWKGFEHYQATLVSYNGRSFDMPLLEMAAFRYGVSAPGYFRGTKKARHRYGDAHRDLHDFMNNYGACRLAGGLNLLSKLLGKPGKMETSGSLVYDLYRAGKVKEINDYCMHDVLDTYFVFLRSCVLTGEITIDQEQELVRETKEWLTLQAEAQPHLHKYLENWGDWTPWP